MASEAARDRGDTSKNKSAKSLGRSEEPAWSRKPESESRSSQRAGMKPTEPSDLIQKIQMAERAEVSFSKTSTSMSEGFKRQEKRPFENAGAADRLGSPDSKSSFGKQATGKPGTRSLRYSSRLGAPRAAAAGAPPPYATSALIHSSHLAHKASSPECDLWLYSDGSVYHAAGVAGAGWAVYKGGPVQAAGGKESMSRNTMNVLSEAVMRPAPGTPKLGTEKDDATRTGLSPILHTQDTQAVEAAAMKAGIVECISILESRAKSGEAACSKDDPVPRLWVCTDNATVVRFISQGWSAGKVASSESPTLKRTLRQIHKLLERWDELASPSTYKANSPGTVSKQKHVDVMWVPRTTYAIPGMARAHFLSREGTTVALKLLEKQRKKEEEEKLRLEKEVKEKAEALKRQKEEAEKMQTLENERKRIENEVTSQIKAKLAKARATNPSLEKAPDGFVSLGTLYWKPGQSKVPVSISITASSSPGESLTLANLKFHPSEQVKSLGAPNSSLAIARSGLSFWNRIKTVFRRS